MDSKFSESAEQLLHDEETATFMPSKRKTNSQTYLWTAQVLFFLLSLTLFIKSRHHEPVPSPSCSEDHMPMYSPVLEAVEGTGHYHRFDGSFATFNKYKGPPSPEIDAAWGNLTYDKGGVVSVSEETLLAVNASREYSVRLPDEVGGGYMASVEVLHQLHCLNMLREATYEDYYKDKAGEWKDSAQTLRYHLDHCVDNLRQKLMCDADAGILTYVWVKGHEGPFPDFSVQHKCRNFFAIQDWVTQNQLFIPGGQIERVPGAQELESPP